jgi:hypothetical protein
VHLGNVAELEQAEKPKGPSLPRLVGRLLPIASPIYWLDMVAECPEEAGLGGLISERQESLKLDSHKRKNNWNSLDVNYILYLVRPSYS